MVTNNTHNLIYTHDIMRSFIHPLLYLSIYLSILFNLKNAISIIVASVLPLYMALMLHTLFYTSSLFSTPETTHHVMVACILSIFSIVLTATHHHLTWSKLPLQSTLVLSFIPGLYSIFTKCSTDETVAIWWIPSLLSGVVYAFKRMSVTSRIGIQSLEAKKYKLKGV